MDLDRYCGREPIAIDLSRPVEKIVQIEIAIGIEIEIGPFRVVPPFFDIDFDTDFDFDGDALIMRHFFQIVPRYFDISPNFEVVKYNIICSGQFNYKSIWARS